LEASVTSTVLAPPLPRTLNVIVDAVVAVVSLSQFLFPSRVNVSFTPLMGGVVLSRMIAVLLSVAGSVGTPLLSMPVMLMFPPMPVKVLPTPGSGNYPSGSC
jgi:hypothetical protein